MQKKIKKAVIPAAGLGTRFLPATKAQPKEMLPIVDKPTLQYIIEEAVASGIEEILIITGKNKKSIEDHFDKSVELELELEQKGKTELLEIVRDISQMVNIYYIRQKEPKGLGDAIYCARSFIGDEPFAVMLGDDIVDNDVPCLKQLMSAYVEKPEPGKQPSNIAILGRYIITPEIFEVLENQAPGKGGEVQLTDALKTLSKKEAMYAYEFEGRRYDVGDKLGFLEATVDFALKKPELKDSFMDYLKKVCKETNIEKEVALTEDSESKDKKVIK